MVKKLNVFVIFYLDDILIYTKDAGQAHINAVCWVLEELRKHGLFAKLKKCRFYKDKICFLGYVLSAQEIRIEDEKIEAVRNWPELKSIRDIQVFLGFANFYWRFIQSFNKIAGPLTLILKTSPIQSAENSSLLINVAEDAEVGFDGGDCEDRTIKKSPRSKNSNKAGDLTPKARLKFTQLRKTFTKAPILQHFDSECHIRIKTNASGYV